MLPDPKYPRNSVAWATYKIHHDARDCRCIYTICEHLHKRLFHHLVQSLPTGGLRLWTVSLLDCLKLRQGGLEVKQTNICLGVLAMSQFSNEGNIVALCQTFWEIRCNSSSAKPLAQNMLKLRAAPLQCQCGVLSPLLADNWAGSWSKLLTSNLPNGF
jgi:hypothetical protein